MSTSAMSVRSEWFAEVALTPESGHGLSGELDLSGL